MNTQSAQSKESSKWSGLLWLDTDSNINGQVHLPEPDPDNITVLSHSLPNTPILPWNHYDSPWQEPETESPEEAEDSACTSEKEDEAPSTTTNEPDEME